MLLFANVAIAQVKIGNKVPEIIFNTVLNSTKKNVKLSDFKGKIVLLEFWATWCSPCVAAMPRLQLLQKKYKDNLQIITVSDETKKRIQLFLNTKPSNLLFAIDTSRKISELFPHRTIPHAVLIDSDGKLIINTHTDEINEQVIAALIKKEKPKLTEKADNLSKDFEKDYFFASDTVTARLMIQAKIEGAPSMSKGFRDNKIFAGRRLMLMNLSLENMYRMAYGDFAYGRVIDRTVETEKNKKELFCLDLITKLPQELLPTLKAELMKRFDLQAKIEQAYKSVYVLKIEDIEKVNNIKINNSSAKGSYGAGSGTFSGEGVEFKDIANYLEAFGVIKLPVVDETGINTKFDIQLIYQPEKPETLKKALGNLGLKLEKAERNIDMLVLYK